MGEVQVPQRRHDRLVKVRYGARIKTDGFGLTLAGRNLELMIEKIEVKLKDAIAIGNRASRQSPGSTIPGTCQEWLTQGVCISRTLPTI